MVPSADGRVRKVRVRASLLAGLFAAIGLVAAFFMFLASDYARIQMLRAKNYLYLKNISAERDRLVQTTSSLEVRLGELEALKEKSDSYERELKGRMKELASIVGAGKALGISAGNTPPVAAAIAPRLDDPEQGIGGAEIKCVGEECVELEGSSARASLNPGFLNQDVGSEDDLVESLDRYIAALRSFPIGTPALGHVSSAFGVRESPFGGGIGVHEGMDYNLPVGSLILSTGEGVVRDVRRTSTYGLVVDIAHSDRVVTRYAHLSKAFVAPGEKICNSEPIGLVGSTGRSTGPHLHYEVRVDGKALDPELFLDFAQRLQRLAAG